VQGEKRVLVNPASAVDSLAALTFVHEIVETSNVEISHSVPSLLGESNFVGELEKPQFCGRYVDYETFIFATVASFVCLENRKLNH
jgi:hypothetical protein